MLGMVFTEFIEMVESKFSRNWLIRSSRKPHPATAAPTPPSDYYDHSELVAMVMSLSKRSNIAVPELVRAFGHHLLGRFTTLYPAMFERHQDLFEFLAID